MKQLTDIIYAEQSLSLYSKSILLYLYGHKWKDIHTTIDKIYGHPTWKIWNIKKLHKSCIINIRYKKEQIVNHKNRWMYCWPKYDSIINTEYQNTSIIAQAQLTPFGIEICKYLKSQGWYLTSIEEKNMY